MLYESLRLFRKFNDGRFGVWFSQCVFVASGHLMIREAWEDTVIQVPNPIGQEGSTNVAVPKGTHIVIDMIGVRESNFRIMSSTA